jgi:hypothetical protein
MYLVLSMLTAILLDQYHVAILNKSTFVPFIKSRIFLPDLCTMFATLQASFFFFARKLAKQEFLPQE